MKKGRKGLRSCVPTELQEALKGIKPGLLKKIEEAYQDNPDGRGRHQNLMSPKPGSRRFPYKKRPPIARWYQKSGENI